MSYPWHLYFMALMYITTGICHFIKPKIYLRVMPKYLPSHKFLVYLSGITEILLGVLVCFPLVKNKAIFAIISMLLLFLMVHTYMLSNKKASTGIPKWVLILRIPLQFGLMFWAYYYLKF